MKSPADQAMKILGIETSCDETSAAVVEETGDPAKPWMVRSNVIASQGLLHARYGGVVPEIASRHHLELIDAVTADALERAGARLDDIDTVAVTRGPGLIGALLVGVSSAKAIAATRRLPLVPVDHLHGHVVASTLGDNPVEPPYLRLALALLLGVFIAVIAALALKRLMSGAIRLPARAGHRSWLSLGGREIVVHETHRVSVHGDVCRLGWRGQQYLVLITAGGVTVLREMEDTSAEKAP